MTGASEQSCFSIPHLPPLQNGPDIRFSLSRIVMGTKVQEMGRPASGTDTVKGSEITSYY